MAEDPNVQAKTRRATLQEWATIPILNYYINLRILLEPIGILRIVLVVLTLFAFSLTAGFSNNGNSNQHSCLSSANNTQTVTSKFAYPFRDSDYEFTYDPQRTNNDSICSVLGSVTNSQAFSGSAQYFVLMSVVSFIFGIVMVIVYVLAYSPKYEVSKYISIVDFIVTLLLAFFYLLADIAWSAGTDSMRSFNRDLLKERLTTCYNCSGDAAGDPTTQNFVQLRFSLLFGWIATIVLIASLWFAYKDTLMHINKMGPWYRMSFYTVKRGGGESNTTESQTKEDQYYEPSPSPPPGVPDNDE